MVLNKTKILLVDDDIAEHRLIREILSDYDINVEVDSAFSGEEAIKKVNYDYDLVISDVRMPQMQGIDLLKQIKKKFSLRGYTKMPQMNKKQAYKPLKAEWIPNKTGTANGIIWKVNQKIIITFPGVPKEMYQMWTDTAKPYLRKLAKGDAFFSRTLKFTGIGESALAEKINSFFDSKSPTVAPYASLGEVKIRVTAKASTKTKAKKIVMPVIKKILSKTKEYYFGDDDETLEKLIAKKLTKRKQTIAIAESCTGGLLSKRLTDITGSSKYIKLNVVSYSYEAKTKILNVSKELLKKYGAVSSEVAKSMAIGIRNLTGCDYGLSITGIAGPGGSTKQKPVGLVYFGLATKNSVKTEKKLFGINSKRENIRWLSTQFALNWFRKELK